MTRLVVVADDLTGAADSAAPLTRLGRTCVVLEADTEWPSGDVVSVDTDSRHCIADLAAARVSAVTERALALGAQVVKKVDSTLRGNIAAEVRAMAEVTARKADRALLVVAPSFPATARTTLGGVVHVDGRRLAAHGSDGDVVGLLERGGLRTGRVGLAGLDSPARLAASLDEEHASGLDAVVVDGETDAHLRTVVAAGAIAEAPVLLVGSGGLTRPLAGPGSDASAAAGAVPVVVVVGSYAAISRTQRERLVEHGLVPVVLDGQVERTAARVRDALREGPVVLSTDPAAAVVRADASRVARSLGAAAAAVLADVGTLVVTGGETARAVLTAAGVTRFEVIGEVEPGIVRGRVPEHRLDLVTKAGSFGDADALLRCLPGKTPGGGTAR